MKTADLPTGVNSQGTSLHLEEPVILAQMCTLDNSLSNEFSNFLLRGKNLVIPCHGYYTVPHVVTNGAAGYQVAMTRSLSRLSKIYQTYLNSDNDKVAADFKNPDLNASNQFEWQAQISSVKYPSWGALATTPEKWWNLQQAVGTHSSVFHSNAIDLADW